MLQSTDLDSFKDIPGFKVILKAVLNSQIQQLVKQLYSYTKDECFFLTVNAEQGVLSNVGSQSGQNFMKENEDLKSKFLDFCVQNQTTGSPVKTFAQSGTKSSPGLSSNRRTAKTSSQNPVIVALVRNKPYSKTHPRPKTSGQKRHFQNAHLLRVKSMVTIPDTDNDGIKIETNVTDQSDNDDDDDDINGDDDDDNISSEENAANVYGGDTDEVCDSTCDIGQQITDIVMGTSENIGDNNGGKNDKRSVKLESQSEDELAEFRLGNIDTEIGPRRLELTPSGSGKRGNQTANKVENISKNEKTEEFEADSKVLMRKTTSKNTPAETPVNQCNICGKLFSNKYNLNRHVKSHSTNAIRCGTCNLFFDTDDRKQLHMAKRHKTQICDVCGYQTNHRSLLNKHMQIKHGQGHCYRCTFVNCFKTFYQKAVFEDHLNTHLKTRPYSCQSCSKTFHSRYIKRAHEKVCLLDGYVCNTCGQSFPHRGSLHNHKKIVHDGRRFICKCGAIFRYKTGLTKHQNMNH